MNEDLVVSIRELIRVASSANPFVSLEEEDYYIVHNLFDDLQSKEEFDPAKGFPDWIRRNLQKLVTPKNYKNFVDFRSSEDVMTMVKLLMVESSGDV